MPRLDAVIYDMDGVLLDSEPFWQEAEQDAFRRVNIPYELEDGKQTMGMRVDQVVDYWFERRPWDLALGNHEDVVAWIEKGVMERVTERGALMKGVHESIDFFRSSGVRLALASSTPFPIINHVLTTLDLVNVFEVVHSAQYEVNGKPHPDVYLTALRLLGVTDETALAIEDSPNGVRAAKAAGITCIAVPDAAAHDKTAFDHADVILQSLLEIDAPLIHELGF
jgi:sugar-phosphatase